MACLALTISSRACITFGSSSLSPWRQSGKSLRPAYAQHPSEKRCLVAACGCLLGPGVFGHERLQGLRDSTARRSSMATPGRRARPDLPKQRPGRLDSHNDRIRQWGGRLEVFRPPFLEADGLADRSRIRFKGVNDRVRPNLL